MKASSAPSYDIAPNIEGLMFSSLRLAPSILDISPLKFSKGCVNVHIASSTVSAVKRPMYLDLSLLLCSKIVFIVIPWLLVIFM